MQTATTKQFRNAVRTAARLYGSRVTISWTDAPSHRSYLTKRYVGMEVLGYSADVAEMTEGILNFDGLTANTRIGRNSKCMIRGTCVRA